MANNTGQTTINAFGIEQLNMVHPAIRTYIDNLIAHTQACAADAEDLGVEKASFDGLVTEVNRSISHLQRPIGTEIFEQEGWVGDATEPITEATLWDDTAPAAFGSATIPPEEIASVVGDLASAVDGGGDWTIFGVLTCPLSPAEDYSTATSFRWRFLYNDQANADAFSQVVRTTFKSDSGAGASYVEVTIADTDPENDGHFHWYEATLPTNAVGTDGMPCNYAAVDEIEVAIVGCTSVSAGLAHLIQIQNFQFKY